MNGAPQSGIADAPESGARSFGAAGGASGRFAATRKNLMRRRRRNNIIAVSVTSAIVALAFFWVFAFHLYTVSSNSMFPALMGMPGFRDQLLCWRAAFLYREPRRWEMATFLAPPTAADREVMPGLFSGGESGITVKRIVGMPGERLAVAAGDIWTAPLGNGRFELRAKPDSEQQRMWIDVYEEDFGDISAEEFLFFWERNGELDISPEGVLALGGGTGIEYLPRSRTGIKGDVVSILPGIPDRYFLPQDVHFLCANPECRHTYQAHIRSQKIQARCPSCGLMNDESAVGFYGYRSGLPETGPYAVGTVGTFQGDTRNYRTNSYYFVRDLRVVVEWRPEGEDGVLEMGISGDGRSGNAIFHRDRVEFDGAAYPVSPEPDADGWLRSEFQVVDGMARIFVGEKRAQAVEAVHDLGDEIDFLRQPAESGVRIAAGASPVAIRRIDIDRDVHYFVTRMPRRRGAPAAPASDYWYEIPEGYFLPLGDNATVSLDGRRWGPVPLRNLKGSVLLIWRSGEKASWL